MQNKKKNKKLSEGEGFTLGGGSQLGLSIGALIGAPREESAAQEQNGGTDARAEAAAPIAAKSDAAAEKAKKSEQGKTHAAAAEPPKISKVALQRQRAGRGGKTVTLVILPQDYKGDKAALAKEMRKALGCGSTIEEGKIVLQGDISDRAEAWLAKKGVAKITKSA